MAVLAGSGESCNTATLCDYLAERGLLAYGQTDPAELTERNHDRVRLLLHIANNPEGIQQSVLVHRALKGVDPTTYHGTPDLSGDLVDDDEHWREQYYRDPEYIALDGSDDDYQFSNRFVNDLDAETDLVRLEHRADDETRGRWVFPTPALLDLISAGITETPAQSDDLVYDRQWCEKMLKSVRGRGISLSDAQKDHLGGSLRRYIQRVRDYRLVFDVTRANRSGIDTRRMTKPMATRFSDEGRVDRTFAMLQDALEWGAEHADTAVFCTLTTDPKKFDSLYEAITAINENFHALNSYLARDPSTKEDTRKAGVPAWSGPDCDTTGRPRERLQYTKVLEFTEKGYPHLHVLYFDPPRRESDGMPWLIDKAELSHQWNKDTEKRTGQGRIVDTYPLVYRDDLDTDAVEAEFNTHEGFVSWYRYGDHEHDDEWIEERAQWHQEQGQIDFDGADENPMEKTAGSYIGKYLSETYSLLTELEELDDPDFDVRGGDGKSSWWKLALYWVTERRFWTPSRQIRRDIELDDNREDIRRGVADATATSLEHHAERLSEDHALYPGYDRDKARSILVPLVKELVAEGDLEAQRATETQTTLARVDYRGAYHYADLPESPDQTIDHTAFETAVNDPDEPLVLATNGDRPPPVADAF